MKMIASLKRVTALAALALSLTSVDAALGHTYLVDSFPLAKERVTFPLKTIRLRFAGIADALYSTVRLETENGVVLAERRQRMAKRELELPAPALEPGRYRVHYRVLSADGDIVEGAVEFLVEKSTDA